MKKELIAVLILLFVITAFIFRSYFLAGLVPLPYNLLVSHYSPWKFEQQYRLIPNKPLGYDNLKLFIPFRKYTTERLQQGEMPLWNPYVFSGNVHAATYQAAVLYPPALLYLFLPLDDAWTILTMLQPLMSGIGLYLFVRSLHRSIQASVIAALGWAFSGWMITNWQEVHVQVHTILFLPYMLYASLKLWQQHDRKTIVLFGGMLVAAFVSSVFAGFLQMSIYSLFILAAWNVYILATRPQIDRRKTIPVLVILGIAALCLSAPQWLPALEAFTFSPRGVVDSKVLFETFLSPPWFLLTALIPDFWGNQGSYNYFSPLIFVTERIVWVALPVLFFAIYGLCTSSKSNHHQPDQALKFPWVRFRKNTVYLDSRVGENDKVKTIHVPDQRNFFKVLTLLSLSLGFSLPTSWLFYVLKIPIMDAAQPSRIFAVAALGVSIVAAYGYDAFTQKYNARRTWRILGVGAITFFVAGLFIFGISGLWFFLKQAHLVCLVVSLTGLTCTQELLQSYTTVSLRNTLLPLLLFIVFAVLIRFFRRFQLIVFLSSLAIIIASTVYQAQKILYFSERSFAYPHLPVLETVQTLAGTHRVMSIGESYILRNFLSQYRIYSAEGYDALFPQWYGELLHSSKMNGTWTTQITRTDADISIPGQGEIITNNPYRLRLMELLGVKYILEAANAHPTIPNTPLPKELFTPVWSDRSWTIYEYKHALPRAVLTHSILRAATPQETLDYLYNTALSLQDTVVVDSLFPEFSSVADTNDQVTITAYTPERVVLQAVSLHPRVLVLTDTYVPGWKATVNGAETPVYRVNYALRGVILPAGEHTVTFFYDPASWRVSLFLAGTGIVLLGSLCVYVLLLRKK